MELAEADRPLDIASAGGSEPGTGMRMMNARCLERFGDFWFTAAVADAQTGRQTDAQLLLRRAVGLALSTVNRSIS